MRSDTPAAALESKIHISASVVKASRNDFLLSGKEMKELESEMKRHMETKINQLIRKCQRENVDPFGFGEYVRSCTHHWDNETFYKDYGSMDIRSRGAYARPGWYSGIKTGKPALTSALRMAGLTYVLILMFYVRGLERSRESRSA